MAVWIFIIRRSRTVAAGSACDGDRQGFIAFDEAGIHPPRFPDYLDMVEALHDFFPDDLQLQFGKPDSDAAVNTEAERDVGARPRAVDDEVIGTLDHLVVAVAGDIPHHHLVALFEVLAAELGGLERGPAHMRQRRLPADHLRNEAID